MGILDRLAQIVSPETEKINAALTYRVALGALLSLTARADNQVTAEELAAQKAILSRRGYTQPEEQQEILTAAQKALEERLDWEGFTREVNEACEYEDRVKLVEDLFAIAWADRVLANEELETIRKIANLLWIDSKDFSRAKLSAKPGPEK